MMNDSLVLLNKTRKSGGGGEAKKEEMRNSKDASPAFV